MIQWAIAVFAVAGVFLIGGFAGAFISIAIGVWKVLGAGFLAAFGVVCVAYLSAPRRKFSFAVACFFLGAFIAWRFLGNSYYPESYEKAYQHTNLPFAVTCGGGFLGLLALFVIDLWCRRRRA